MTGSMRSAKLVPACLAAVMALVASVGRCADGGAWSLDLAGDWTVSGTNFSGRLSLPGTLADAKLGRRMTAGDWRATTDKRQKGALMRAYQYTGPATYARELELAPAEAGRPLEIVLERVMWKSAVRWDGTPLGEADSLSTPHVHAVPAALATTGRHRLEIDVDNSRFYGFSGWSHSYGPVMQSVWHGVLGRMEVRPVDPLADVRVFPFPAADRKVAVEVPRDFRALLGQTLSVEGLAAVSLDEAPSPYRPDRKLVTVHLGETPVEWSEFRPKVYTLVLGRGTPRRIGFGFRRIETRGHDLVLNGHPLFMRGNLDCCNFPLTGAPDMSVDGWRRIFERLRREGVNTVRFHSWCPPEAAFSAADELGLYLGIEAAIWSDSWMDGASPVGCGKPIDGFVRRELAAILGAYGNHPSFVSLGIGNELSVRFPDAFTTMGGWMADCRRDDPRRLYFVTTANAVSPGDDYCIAYFRKGAGRLRGRFEPHSDWDYEEVYSKVGIPCVAHEIGQWVSYPDWNELAKYTGALRPFNLEVLRDKAVANGTLRFNREYSRASGRLVRLMYRDEVESFFRTRSCSGFQLLGIQDFSGQFEALIGWLDSFYDVKPAVRDLPPFSQVCNALPHLVRLPKYVWEEGETFEARLFVRNLTDRAIPAGRAFGWSSGSRSGTFTLAAPLAVGDIAEVGKVSFPLVGAEGVRRTLRFGENEWTFWAFPRRSAAKVPANVVLTADYEAMVRALGEGRRVVYVGDSVGMGTGTFKPVFWSTAFFPNAAAETATLGAWVDVEHPALAGFPTEDWTDFQWQSLADGARIHRLAGLPRDYRPIVMPVPDLHHSTFLGSLFELAVGDGRLLVCGYAIEDPQGPAAVALRNSILDYASGEAFRPSAKADPAWLASRFRLPWRDRLTPRPDEFRKAPVYIECAAALPKDGSTGWQRGYDRAELTQGTYRLAGDKLTARKDRSGAFWQGRRIDLRLLDVLPVVGELCVRFRDPDRRGRTGRGTFEGEAFAIPRSDESPDGGSWVRLPLTREQGLDGRLEFSCEALTGPDLLIDRVVILPRGD